MYNSSNKYRVLFSDYKIKSKFIDVPLDETPAAPPNTPVIDISENSYLLNLKKKKFYFLLFW